MGAPTIGLVLSGGGARGAYQAGVLHAVAEVCRDLGRPSPFAVLTGTSAGALNAVFWAAQAHDVAHGGERLRALWSSLTTDSVFRTDPLGVGRVGLQWMTDLSLGGLIGVQGRRALLDTRPLKTFLERHLPLGNIQLNIESGHLRAVAVTAIDYGTSAAITFVQGGTGVRMWERPRRWSEPVELSVGHVLGSSAIPLFFPPARVGDRYFGDGCVRNGTPLSPAIHLGAERLLVVSVRTDGSSTLAGAQNGTTPSVARVLNTLLSSVLLDGIDVDVERLRRINAWIRAVDEAHRRTLPYKPIELVWIRPSRDIARMARERSNRLPGIIRYLMRGLGPVEDASELVSYLLFDADFCRRLAELGYADAMRQRPEIEHLLRLPLRVGRGPSHGARAAGSAP